MRAAVLDAVDEMSIGEVQVAEPARDEVLVRVVASGVCHSDLNMFAGHLPTAMPQVLGHEVAGVVERIGADVTSVAVGDTVVTCPSGFCGHCRWCMSGQLHLCVDKHRARPAGQLPRLARDGVPVVQFAGLGGFAEQMLVHASAVAAVPREMPLDRAALLGCAVVTGFGSVLNAARVRPGQTVAVIGCGGVGLNVVQAARYVGASRIIAVDRVAAKLERARAFGATDVVDASAVDPVAAVQELTKGGVDQSFEVVGRPGTIEQAFGMLGLRGTATVVGVAKPADTVTIPALALLSEKRLQGAQMGSSRFPLDVALFAQLYLDGRLELDALVSRRITLDDVTEALRTLDDSTGARSVITF